MNWLLLRGLGRESRHWGRFPEMSDGYCLSLDLPGSGQRHKDNSPATIKGIVAELKGRWNGNPERQGPWGLIALSLGGMIALEWCASHPQDFAGLVLINSSAAKVCRPWERLRPQGLASLIKIMGKKDLLEREIEILHLISNGAKVIHEELAKVWAAYAKECPMSRQNLLKQIWAANRFTLPARLKSPVLVLGSSHDRMVDKNCSLKLADYLERGGTKTTLAIHPTAGHDLPLDDPHWVWDQISRWSPTLLVRS